MFKRSSPTLIEKLKNDATAVLLLDTYNNHGMAEQRKLMVELMLNDCHTPVITAEHMETLLQINCSYIVLQTWGFLLMD